MPIPTDTYWNIKRLNILFAVSAVVMMLTLAPYANVCNSTANP